MRTAGQSARGFMSGVHLTVTIGLVLGIGCGDWRRSSETPSSEPLPRLLQVPEAFWAEAHGTISVGDMTVPGRVRVHYLVYPNQRVVIPTFAVWMEDLDVVVTFLWWETEREQLRCTFFSSGKAIEGRLEDGELVIPAGMKVIGQSYSEKGVDGACHGKGRRLDAEAPVELRAVHDPELDRFALSASFETSSDDHPFTVSLTAQGHYLNRPPVALLRVTGQGVEAAEDGCPVTRKGKPPIAIANTAQGLLVSLRSDSYDPDGVFAPGQKPKRPRVDLSFEQWSRSRPGGFSFLGAGREVGPVLFETGREHQLLLWVTDRKGAEGRKLCRFQVVAPN